MAVYIQPPRRTGLQDFTEALSPYLQMAFQTQLQQIAQENQQRKALEQISESFPGVVQQQISPEGQEYIRKKTGGVPTEKQSKYKVPQKFKKYILSPENLPSGTSLDLTQAGIPTNLRAPRIEQPQPIVDSKGQVIGYRPPGSVFQPATASDFRKMLLGITEGENDIKLEKPDFVSQDDWNKATDEQKREFLASL